MNKDLIVSIVVSVYNQQRLIGRFLDTVLDVLKRSFRNYELIVVDDASVDETAKVVLDKLARQANIRLLVLSRHYGDQVAVTAGIDHAIGDFLVLMSPDLRDPPERIPELVKRAQEGHDVVYVAKPPNQRRGWLERLSSALFYRVSKRLTGFAIDPDATDFRVLSRRVVNSITRLREHNRFLRMLFAYVGYDVDKLPGTYREADTEARAGRSFISRASQALDALIAFSSKPLRYVALLSLTLSFLGFVWSLTVIIRRLLSPERFVEGWASLMTVHLFTSSLLFLLLALISEYVSRILVESKNRPLYYVREEHGGTQFSITDIVESDDEPSRLSSSTRLQNPEKRAMPDA